MTQFTVSFMSAIVANSNMTWDREDDTSEMIGIVTAQFPVYFRPDIRRRHCDSCSALTTGARGKGGQRVSTRMKVETGQDLASVYV